MQFRLGDRVLCVARFDGNESIVGLTGTIRALEKHWASVEYDEPIERGHDCDNSCQSDYGWNTGYECLELYQEPDFTTEVAISYEALNI